MKEILTPGQIEEFHQKGLLVVKDFYNLEKDIEPIQQGIYEIIGQVMIKNQIADTRPGFTPEHFDDGYQELILKDRSWGAEIYDAVKQLPAFYRLIAHPSHDLVFRQLRKESIPGIAAGGHGIRIDNPLEDKFRAFWHQEYPAQLRSIDGLVFWSSLIPLTEALGPVQFCPGSHRAGPLPVESSDPDNSGRFGAYALRLHDEENILSRYPKIAPLTGPGDLVIIDFLVLHASGHNRDSRSRWTMQFRYFNFADPIGRSHGWKGSFAAGVDFSTVHPGLSAHT